MKGRMTVSTLVLIVAAPLAVGAGPGGEDGGQSAEPEPGMSGGAVGQSEEIVPEAQFQNPIMQMPAGQLADRNVITPAGERIGQVQKVVVEPEEQQAYVVVRVGGFFGFGARSVAIPVEELRLRNEDLNMTEQVAGEELAERYPYRAERFRPAEGNQSLAAAVSMAAGEYAVFSRLDRDGDGFVSRTEAEGHPLLEQWQAADSNGDDRIDKEEFSALEETVAAPGMEGGLQPLRTPTGLPPMQSRDGSMSNRM